MKLFESKDQESSVRLEKTGAFGSGAAQTSEYSVQVSSSGFEVSLNKVAFDSDELRMFQEQVREMIQVKRDFVLLRALADFTVEIMPEKDVESFLVRFTLETPRNNATISAVYDASTLMSLSDGFALRLVA